MTTASETIPREGRILKSFRHLDASGNGFDEYDDDVADETASANWLWGPVAAE
ncbi:hypothetical protein ABII15_30755 [Streptomyces sp. HUAS MG91]|uniref:Uncharacterized protein n=1 Tax=Streptomyces tabacisoli TaxID=3156398 RepID=A0AAU8J019_9ACTN